MKVKIVTHAAVQFLYIFVTTTASSQKSSSDSALLDRLLGSQSSKPVIVVVNLDGRRPRSSDLDDLLGESGDDGLKTDVDDEVKDNHDSDDAYYLYHLLKDVIDPYTSTSSSSEDDPKPAKEILRSALRMRCKKVEICVQQCPPRKPKCPRKCKKNYDSLNMCPPPPPRDPCEKKPKCGKTMPPKWRL